MALFSWQPWSKLATGVEASHQLGVSQKAWDLDLRKYILRIVQQYLGEIGHVIQLEFFNWLKVKSLLTWISGRDWSASARVALQYCQVHFAWLH